MNIVNRDNRTSSYNQSADEVGIESREQIVRQEGATRDQGVVSGS
ncbi:hypothetical protein HZU77_013040 [Neisseriaceae bacterium TC5R-5]|nr:hypothetical protein [Neisseriaceae bacterium TC5R-5]